MYRSIAISRNKFYTWFTAKASGAIGQHEKLLSDGFVFPTFNFVITQFELCTERRVQYSYSPRVQFRIND